MLTHLIESSGQESTQSISIWWSEDKTEQKTDSDWILHQFVYIICNFVWSKNIKVDIFGPQTIIWMIFW